MVIPEQKEDLTKQFIQEIYTHPLDEQTILDLTPLINQMFDSHYFTILIFPNMYEKKRKYISTNSSSYSRLYCSLHHDDLLLQNLVNGNKISIAYSVTREQCSHSEEFIIEMFRNRPVSDICYVPLNVNGYLAGFICISRAGTNSRFIRILNIPKLDAFNKPFSENEVRLFSFIGGFINEGFKRTLQMTVTEDRSAYFNMYGQIVAAGQHIEIVLKEVFGKRMWNMPFKSGSPHGENFKNKFQKFLAGPQGPGCGEFCLTQFGRTHRFIFSYLQRQSIRPYFPDEPQVKLTLLPGGRAAESVRNESVVKKLTEFYGLTLRELDVVDNMYRGMSNKEISETMRITEGTVKRHISNIFAKTGVKSRVQYIFKINADDNLE